MPDKTSKHIGHKLQCYEADGWGACGSSPDTVVTISPEYNNAVLHGTGVGTMTSDICSDTLNINDATNGPVICGTNETYNFYKWTSPQASPQTYSIYVTYQLPSTFKEFASGQTSLMGRTNSANAAVSYRIFRSDSSGLTPCSAAVSVSTGVQTSWQTKIASGAADPSTCGFEPGDSVVFQIDMVASTTANAYISNSFFMIIIFFCFQILQFSIIPYKNTFYMSHCTINLAILSACVPSF
jgi:hypothetical protein